MLPTTNKRAKEAAAAETAEEPGTSEEDVDASLCIAVAVCGIPYQPL